LELRTGGNEISVEANAGYSARIDGIDFDFFGQMATIRKAELSLPRRRPSPLIRVRQRHASVSVSPTLPSGQLTWNADAQVQVATSTGVHSNFNASTVIGAQVAFIANHSGVFHFNSELSEVSGEFANSVGLFSGGGHAILWLRGIATPLAQYVGTGSGVPQSAVDDHAVSWTYELDDNLPTAGIFDAEGNLLTSSEDHLSFTAETAGTYYLAISHDAAWTDPLMRRAIRTPVPSGRGIPAITAVV